MFDIFQYVDIVNLLSIPLTLFFLGLWGIVVLRKNLIFILISIELLLLGVNLSLILVSLFLDDLLGEVFSLFVLTIAGAESAIGLAILVSFYRLQNLISIDLVSFLKS